jgi:hypothetical protein
MRTGVAAAGGLVLAGSLLLTGCGGAPKPAANASTAPAPSTASASPSVTTSTPPAPAGPVGPLSGQPVAAAVASRSAVAVVVVGRAPTGLDKADVVIEELSDGLRWVAIYQSQEAQVSPVGLARPMDGSAIGVEKPVYAFAGGEKGVLTVIGQSGAVAANLATGSAVYAGSLSAPTVATATLRGAYRAGAAVPLLSYRAVGEPQLAASRPARQVTIVAPGQATQVWAYDAGARLWRRTGGGPPAASANLVVQVVPYKSVQLQHPKGPFVPSARVIGTGASYVLSGPSLVEGLWRKAGVATATSYGDAHGVGARMLPGQTWIVLAPVGTTVTPA